FNHLTYFFNAKREEAFELEDRFMIDSNSDVKLHDDIPEMKAAEIAQRLVQEMTFENYDFIATNLCNADLVGHSGNIPAVVKGVEAVDAALAKILPVAAEHGYEVIVTADHGNDPLIGHAFHTREFVPVLEVHAPDHTGVAPPPALAPDFDSLASVGALVAGFLGLPEPG
ncbi:MAG: alkaline phosphatase family protein, partial [Promicromonosporaceae bacterium]|nr:alkaline phosphatase family protein [Promicromonosporaceae bacterium]